MKCERGHEMVVSSRFRFDDEPGDSPRITAQLDHFRSAGLEMGADVTVWYCATCDVASAFFEYPQ